MSVRTMARVWELSRHAGTDLLMLLAIADFSDDDGLAFPSVEKLAKKCRMSKRNAQDRLRALSESGELTILKNQGPPPKYPNLFRVNLELLGVKHASPVQPAAPVQYSVERGAAHYMAGVKPTAPKPSVNHQDPSITCSANKPRRISSPSASDAVPEGFDEFWIAYDKKVGKASAIKVWKSIRPDIGLIQRIVSAAKRYSLATERQYRKDPERWLKGCRWEDDSSSVGSEANPDIFAGGI